MGRKTKNENLTYNLITYLENHVPVTREQICQDLYIIHRPMQTLSEQLKKIRQLGYEITTPPRSSIIQNIKKPDDHYEKIDNSCIYKTLIMMILSSKKRPLSEEEISSQLYDFFSIYDDKHLSIYKYLNQLKKEHYVLYDNKKYSISSLHPHYLMNEPETYKHFLDSYEYQSHITTSPEVLENLYFKIDSLVAIESLEHNQLNIYSSQKGSSFTQHTLDNLQLLNKSLYMKYQLDIDYLNSKKEKVSLLFSVGLIVFSYEKNNIYLLGEVQNHKIILKLENIVSIKTTQIVNNIYESKEYIQIFNQMFSISIDDCFDVEVLFKDFQTNNIRKKIEHLLSVRNSSFLDDPIAKIEETSQEYEFIYKDKIRGISDFARYLRTFGSNAIVIKPLELKQMMMNSAKLIQNNYESRGIYTDEQL